MSGLPGFDGFADDDEFDEFPDPRANGLRKADLGGLRADVEGNEHFCLLSSPSGGWVCTRRKQHSGPHVAHHGTNLVCYRERGKDLSWTPSSPEPPAVWDEQGWVDVPD